MHLNALPIVDQAVLRTRRQNRHMTTRLRSQKIALDSVGLFFLPTTRLCRATAASLSLHEPPATAVVVCCWLNYRAAAAAPWQEIILHFLLGGWLNGCLTLFSCFLSLLPLTLPPWLPSLSSTASFQLRLPPKTLRKSLFIASETANTGNCVARCRDIMNCIQQLSTRRTWWQAHNTCFTCYSARQELSCTDYDSSTEIVQAASRLEQTDEGRTHQINCSASRWLLTDCGWACCWRETFWFRRSFLSSRRLAIASSRRDNDIKTSCMYPSANMTLLWCRVLPKSNLGPGVKKCTFYGNRRDDAIERTIWGLMHMSSIWMLLF